MEQKIVKKFLLCEITASELVSFKWFLLRRGYFSLAANVLTSSPKIWHVNKRDFFEHNFLDSDEGI